MNASESLATPARPLRARPPLDLAALRSAALLTRRRYRLPLAPADLVAYGALGWLEASRRDGHVDASSSRTVSGGAPGRVAGAMLDGARRMHWFGRRGARQSKRVEAAGPGELTAWSISFLAPDEAARLAERRQLEEGASTDDALAEDVWLRRRLAHALRSLAPRHREFIRLHYFEGRSADASAKLLGLDGRHAPERLHQGALQALRVSFGLRAAPRRGRRRRSPSAVDA